MDKKVLIVDDSAFIRQLLKELINSIDGFSVIDTAIDPVCASRKIVELKPDIITLDIEMPKMDGLTFLEKIMKFHPIPVLVISSLSEKNSKVTLAAMEMGAVDCVLKPTRNITEVFDELKEEIASKLKTCARVNIKKHLTYTRPLEPKYGTDAVLKKSTKALSFSTTDKVIAIGTSTGGTVALANLFSLLPVSMPGMVVVIHMPQGFTKSFSERLNETTPFNVKEAEDGDAIIPGRILIAPGGVHTYVERTGAKYIVKVKSGPPVNRHCPSVDVLFRSVSQTVGHNAIGIMLTGMGDDGAKGMLEMKEQGAINLAQSEKSALVFGMPKVAIDLGGVDTVASLEDIAKYLLKFKV